MSWIKNISTLIVTLVICFLVLELSSREIFKHESSTLWGERVMLFSEGNVFRNVDDFFIYYPFQNIQSQTFYADTLTGKVLSEYSYAIQTNNAGLVQTRDIVPGKSSVIVLGDSFTEGQGASPWFYDFENIWLKENWQVLNGGVLGAGVKQFSSLLSYLQSTYSIKNTKVIVVFISNDFYRPQWVFRDQQIRCLRDHASCVGDEGYYGFPFSSGLSPQQYAQNIYDERTEYGYANIALNYFLMGNIWDSLKSLAKASTFLKMAYIKLNSYRLRLDNRYDNANYQATRDLIDQFKSGVTFIHIWQKDEVNEGHLNQQGIAVRSFFKEFEPSVNISDCRLLPSDFHIKDGHPNRQGYIKVRECVATVANNLVESGL